MLHYVFINMEMLLIKISGKLQNVHTELIGKCSLITYFIWFHTTSAPYHGK